MITITEDAQVKIKEVLEDETPETRLRMYVTGGGCSGFQYGFSMEEGQNDDDFEVPAGATNVLVDALSMQYLENAKVDFTCIIIQSCSHPHHRAREWSSLTKIEAATSPFP